MSKERIIGVLVLMLSVILLASSCSKDEESNNSTPTNKEASNSDSANKEEGNNSTPTNKEEGNNSTPINNDNYYVKYEVLNGSQQSYGTRTERSVTFRDVDKDVTVEITNMLSWEGTYGPFRKGDKVFMRFSSFGKYNATGRLSVSKNKEAFAIKKEKWNSESGKLEYTIDF